jgi:hypothetical protein
MPPPAAPYPVIAVKRVCSYTDLVGQVSDNRGDEVSLFFRKTTVLAPECKLRCQAKLAGVGEGSHESQVLRQKRPKFTKLVRRPQPPHRLTPPNLDED